MSGCVGKEELFMANWRAFMSLEYTEKGKKCLKLSRYGQEWFFCRLVGLTTSLNLTE